MSSKKGKDSAGKSWCCIPNVLPDSPSIQGGLNSQSTCQIGFISTSKTLSSQCSSQRMVGNLRNLRLTRIMAPTLLRLSGSIRPSPFSISPSTGSIRYPCTVPVFTFGFPTTSLTICAVQSVGMTSLETRGPSPSTHFLFRGSVLPRRMGILLPTWMQVLLQRVEPGTPGVPPSIHSSFIPGHPFV